MLPLKEENIKGLEMTFTLDAREQGILAASVKQEWFDLLQKLMEQEIRLLNIKLINMEGTNDEILRFRATVKGAGMFYAGVMQRLSEILQIDNAMREGIGTISNPEIPPMLSDIS